MKRKIFSIFFVLMLVLGFTLVPATPVSADDGSGVCTVIPDEVIAGSTNNTLTFTFTAAETMDGGAISIEAPTGWSAPQGSSGTAGYTTATSGNVTGKVLTALDVTTDWLASTDNITLSADATTKKEGGASLKAAIADPAAAGDKWYYNYASSQNWSSYTKVGFWIQSSVDTAAGDFQFKIAESANLTTPTDTINIPALTAATWKHVTLTFTGVTTTRDAVLSYGLVMAVDKGVVNVFTDEILIGPDNTSAISFSNQVATVRILALANTETITVVYGDGGGNSGATAQQTTGTATFVTKSKVSADGNLAEIVSNPQVTVNFAPLDHIVVSPDTASIPCGGSQTYTAEAFDQYNNSLGDVTANTTWEIEAGAGGSWVDNVYSAEYEGTWTVTGTYNGKSNTASLTVCVGVGGEAYLIDKLAILAPWLGLVLILVIGASVFIRRWQRAR